MVAFVENLLVYHILEMNVNNFIWPILDWSHLGIPDLVESKFPK